MIVTVTFDGSWVEGQRATYGWTIRRKDGELIALAKCRTLRGQVQGSAAAEWAGLVDALAWLAAYRAERIGLVLILGDAKAVIESLHGRLEPKRAYLKRFRNEALAILKQIGVKWEAAWIPRSFNEADGLSR